MRICDLNSGMGQISQGYAKLKERMVETSEVWTDDAYRQFDQQRLNEIPSRLQQLAAAVNRLTEILIEAERECGEPSERS
ncbi:hypothetical protein ETAA8_61050 [Anatilimnocola aggregata]|uniref:Uncharacterized protein n=1 Tax=Anatilimnocola aggregata TaxID=2528021 RepID=A0A517YL53_9BACT|nr:hypothetical protein [Anatilimnocola aggregata]QDU30952.1 hypothetical protein ETAA8_61050 [Anatilimnocola aggregata]